jgi:hypothetical protein
MYDVKERETPKDKINTNIICNREHEQEYISNPKPLRLDSFPIHYGDDSV